MNLIKRYCLLLFIFYAASVVAQDQETIIWASEVYEVSSEYDRLGYAAFQALHKPNVFPAGGENSNAWRPKKDNQEEFITVRFANPIQARQIAIAETENPGAIKEIYAYDEDFLEYPLYELTPRTLPIESRLLNVFFDNTKYKIHAIKVVLDGNAVPGFNSIDAIGISMSNIPISVLIKLVPGINEDFETQKLSKNVNSTYQENGPIISPDGKRLYFSRKYHPENVGGASDPEDIWVSEWDEGKQEWKVAENVGPPLNTAGPNFISSITMVDGEETLILGNEYGKKGRMYSGVSMSKRSGSSFDTPSTVNIENMYNYSPKADFYLSADGKVMIMSIERDVTYGGRDLYVSHLSGNSWSEPLNLGDDVNTASDDYAPFLSEDQQALYYSTKGFSGYGGADIFVTTRLDNTWESWSTPENLGGAINSKKDDQYFTIPLSGESIYYSQGEMDEDTDIFTFEADEMFRNSDIVNPVTNSIKHLTAPRPDDMMVTISGRVLDYQTNDEMKNATVVVERLSDGRDVAEVEIDSTGYFEIEVRGGMKYGIHASKYKYLTQSFNFDFDSIRNNLEVSQDLFLTEIKEEAKIVLNNIFFDFNKSELKPESFAELDRIYGSMTDGQIKRIRISGHTDNIGSYEYNQKLSEERARAVFNYFRKKGIPDYRMQVEGYGETSPIASNQTEEGQSKNRRVEFEILEVQ